MLSREYCFQELGLLPRWRLRGVETAVEDVPAAPAASARQTLAQGRRPADAPVRSQMQGAACFVTFRLADSLPAAVLESLAELPEDQRARRVELQLDQGAGACHLARPELAAVVVEALQQQAENRYTLHEYAVMPNHVHLLLTPLGEHGLSEILHGLMSWTAQRINALLGRSEALWQPESFERRVRDGDELIALASYIRRNPVKARLCAAEQDFRWSSAWNGAAEPQPLPATAQTTEVAPGRPAGSGTNRFSAALAGASSAPAVVPLPSPAVSPAACNRDVAAINRMDWDSLHAAIKSCTACELHKSRTQGVPGVGDMRAEWLFIGEAPGADEDRLGEPFVGPAGKLLDAMLRALRLQRGENVYIANILKSRPPGNRDPRPEEVAACLPYLERQIDLIQPSLIVAVGRIAAQNLLRTDTPIGALRGRVHQYRGLPLVVIYHPAYLLRSPADKAKTWEDLLLAANTMQQLKQSGPA